jgi:hypothetical protein
MSIVIEASKWQRYRSKMPAADSGSTGKGILLRDRSHFDVPKGFASFGPCRCQKALRYIHIPAAFFLALSQMASNLDDDIHGFAA